MAGEAYDKASDAMLQMTKSSKAADSQAFAGAASELLESGRVYIGALRRLAHYAANGEQRRQKAMSHSA